MEDDEAEPVSVAEVTQAYIVQRDLIADAEEEHNQKVTAMKAELDALAEKLLEVCAAQGVDSMKTPSGTVTRSVRTRYWTSDWESMYRFINENDAPWLLEKRISNNMMKQHLEENPDQLPPGLQADRKYAITVRRSTNR